MVDVWPSNQHVAPLVETEPDIKYTKFDGHPSFNENLKNNFKTRERLAFPSQTDAWRLRH